MDLISAVDGVRPIVWYKLRITIDDDKYTPENKRLKHFKTALQDFVEVVKPYVYLRKITSGLELHNSSGEYTYPHIHIHFKSQTKKDTILKKLKRFYEARWDEPMTGLKKYSFKPEHDVNEQRFFRYPLKQATTVDEVAITEGFSDDEVEDMRKVAHAQWKLATEINDAKKTKKDEHTSIYERAKFKLDKLSNPRPLDIILGIQDIYLEENRPVNNVTIQGYALTYMLQNGIVSKQKNAENILSKLNI